ncbi:tRNA lysidine(34) synthetase TilS [Hyphomonas sp.]|uniref:tRNA lysidine(34) synthetase TilS n=1 Tax=Hyphomonas sp. TaxID=87 RepID=UPI00391BC4F5
MPGLSPEASFAAALGALPGFLREGPFGLAVSGGSDSMALLYLAGDYSAQRGTALAVFTVDHGLRPDAAAEAARVADACAQLGLAHRTLQLAGLKTQQAGLRRARHAALAVALKQAGGRLLLTGHTGDDQAETFLMRARQGSGWYGLAGMQALSLSPVWPEGAGVWIARPLLGLRRAELRAWLAGRGEGWSEDPSNDNAAFERVRVRQMLAGAPGLFGQVMRCREDFARLRRLEDRALARWLDQGVEVRAHDIAARFETLPPERAARGLGLLIQAVTGAETPPRSEALARLSGRITGQGQDFRGATLGGARLLPLRDGRVSVRTEHPGRAGADCQLRLGLFRLSLAPNVAENAHGAGKESFLYTPVPMF